MAETVSKVMNLLPEYQEKFLKDLLANIYQDRRRVGHDHWDRGPKSFVGSLSNQMEDGTTWTNEGRWIGRQSSSFERSGHLHDASQRWLSDQYGDACLCG